MIIYQFAEITSSKDMFGLHAADCRCCFFVQVTCAALGVPRWMYLQRLARLVRWFGGTRFVPLQEVGLDGFVGERLERALNRGISWGREVWEVWVRLSVKLHRLSLQNQDGM